MPSPISLRASAMWLMPRRRPNTLTHLLVVGPLPRQRYAKRCCTAEPGRATRTGRRDGATDRWQDCHRSALELRSIRVTIAILHTNAGPIRVELFDNHAPKTVRNFVELAEGAREYTDPRTGQAGNGPYYDGTIFHRVISGFMIQGGDPTGTGRGGPGYQFADEFHGELQFDRPYLLAMANAGPGTNGSQFFITVGPTPHLNRRHTIFGQVADEESAKAVDSIANTPTGPGDRPREDVVIERVTIERA